MVKRAVAAPLWFLAILCLYDLVAYFTGVPRIVGPLVAATVSTIVSIDPGHVVWTARPAASVDGGSLPAAERSAASAASELA